LWSASAAVLAADGHQIQVFKNGLPAANVRIMQLKALRCRLHDLGFGERLGNLPSTSFMRSSNVSTFASAGLLWLRLRVVRRFDLVVISQGGNHDGSPFAAVCRRLRLPYVLISHKASDLHWPRDRWRAMMRKGFDGARANFFVSKHNLRLTEEQIGARVPNARVVFNPFNVPWHGTRYWPSTDSGLRLACLGRLNTLEKGQDLLLRVLSLAKWRARPVTVTFLGAGDERKGLEDMAAFLGLSSVRFAAPTRDIAGFWADHHALVLPSRAEGLPLVIVEALLSGRIAVVTDTGGNAELLDEGVNGFVADAPTEKSLDEALERAWARRSEWEALGAAAATRLRTRIPADPGKCFADILLSLI